MLNNQKGYGNDDNSPLEFYGIWGRQYSDKAISVVLSEVIWIKQKRVKRVKPGWQFEPWLGSHMAGKGCCCARKHARYLIYNDNYMLFSVSLKLFWIMYHYVSTWSHSQSCLMANSFLKGVQTFSYAFNDLFWHEVFHIFFDPNSGWLGFHTRQVTSAVKAAEAELKRAEETLERLQVRSGDSSWSEIDDPSDPAAMGDLSKKQTVSIVGLVGYNWCILVGYPGTWLGRGQKSFFCFFLLFPRKKAKKKRFERTPPSRRGGPPQFPATFTTYPDGAAKNAKFPPNLAKVHVQAPKVGWHSQRKRLQAHRQVHLLLLQDDLPRKGNITR